MSSFTLYTFMVIIIVVIVIVIIIKKLYLNWTSATF